MRPPNPSQERPPQTTHTCEVCGGSDVDRRGIWDHCPKGHSYVGARIDKVNLAPTTPPTPERRSRIARLIGRTPSNQQAPFTKVDDNGPDSTGTSRAHSGGTAR